MLRLSYTFFYKYCTLFSSSRFSKDCLVIEGVVEFIVFLIQSESTLWRLKIFVKDSLEVQSKRSLNTGGLSNNNNNDNNNNNNNNNNKRKREICDAIAKTAKRKSKKP